MKNTAFRCLEPQSLPEKRNTNFGAQLKSTKWDVLLKCKYVVNLLTVIRLELWLKDMVVRLIQLVTTERKKHKKQCHINIFKNEAGEVILLNI